MVRLYMFSVCPVFWLTKFGAVAHAMSRGQFEDNVFQGEGSYDWGDGRSYTGLLS